MRPGRGGRCRAVEMMSDVIIRVCESCGAEQRCDSDVYWSRRHASVMWSVPPDGTNGMRFRGILCVQCRTRIARAIRRAFEAPRRGRVQETKP